MAQFLSLPVLLLFCDIITVYLLPLCTNTRPQNWGVCLSVAGREGHPCPMLDACRIQNISGKGHTRDPGASPGQVVCTVHQNRPNPKWYIPHCSIPGSPHPALTIAVVIECMNTVLWTPTTTAICLYHQCIIGLHLHKGHPLPSWPYYHIGCAGYKYNTAHKSPHSGAQPPPTGTFYVKLCNFKYHRQAYLI